MNQRDEHWKQEDAAIVQRLRDEKPQASGLELDRMKMAAMAKAKPPRSRRAMPKSRIAAALITVGVMAGGTAGTVAATHGSTGSVSAARAEYKPCDRGGKEDRERCRRLHCSKLHEKAAREHCFREQFPLPGEPKPTVVPTVHKAAVVKKTHRVSHTKLRR